MLESESRFSYEYKRSSFSPAFLLVDSQRRKAMQAIYAFARLADDIADDFSKSEEEKEIELLKLRENLSACYRGNCNEPLFIGIRDAAFKFNLPEQDFSAIIDGVSQDIKPFSCDRFSELQIYMDRVAVAPGRLTIKVCGLINEEELLSKNLGYAVQLTNIVRDFYFDAINGRFYIPGEDFRKFNLSRQDAGKIEKNERVKELLSFETDRALHYYMKAEEILKKEKGKVLMPAAIHNIYLTLLLKIRKSNFDIIGRIPKLNAFEKIKALFKTLIISF